MAVTHCVCTDTPFSEVLRLHREEGLTFEEIRDRYGVCDGCTTCEPYVLLTLRTGRVVHPVLSQGEARAILDDR
ncbi:MAG: hypothetical protein Tsb0013_22240 [Phycisphaerales bacterium]